MRIALFSLLLSAGLAISPEIVRAADVPAKESDGSFVDVVQPFLQKYCVKCHGASSQKGDRRFDQLSGAIPDDNALVDLQDILDLLNLGEMPPKESLQPEIEERRVVTRWLTARIERYHQERKSSGNGAVLRRLNSREYRNTIRDLLKLNMTMFDPTAGFPRDQTIEHLDNVGDSLVTSSHLLSGYLDAADRAVEKALFPTDRPAVQSWAFRDGFRQQPEIDQVFRTVSRFEYMTLFDVVGADKHEGAYGPIHAFAEGVPYDGLYEIRLKAEAVNRQHPYDPEFLGTDPDEPFRMGIVAGNHRVGALHKPQPIEPLLAELELADEQKWYTVRVWLDAGYTPRFTFRNGLMDVRSLWGRLLRKYPKLHPKPERRGIVGDRFTAIKYGKLPQIRIHEIEIRGPFYEEGWPRPGQRALLGEKAAEILRSGEMADSQLRSRLVEFASLAYRRPPTSAEVDRLLQVAAARRKAGRNSVQAFADAVKAALCSPAFLYFDQTVSVPEEAKAAAPARLSDWALASRLSCFLWSSMPDGELRNLAATGRLKNPDVLRAQVERMLGDNRSREFIDGFTGSWLTLRDLGATPPDRGQFRNYYHYDLGHAMRQETHLFVRRLIDEDLSLVNFLDSDFTYVNKPLARHYGLKPPAGNGFELVSLPDGRRGGLSGQASVLTVTANGIDTSPVVRGVWLLENILGTPPSPPPPDVEPLDPDVRGAKTIRDQLKKHRESPACYDCHRKIDPLGFALENFDPIGGWRASYSRSARVDASGELPGGETFSDVSGLKKILVRRKSQFASTLTRKLLAYATGRLIEPVDRPHIDRIVRELSKSDYGFRELIHLVVRSEPFLNR